MSPTTTKHTGSIDYLIHNSSVIKSSDDVSDVLRTELSIASWGREEEARRMISGEEQG